MNPGSRANAVAEWRVLAGEAARPYDLASLLAVAMHAHDLVTHAVRTGILRSAHRRPLALSALDRTFGMGDGRHALDTGTRPWSWFREPQVIKGFAHHLDAGSSDTRIARVTAFLAAVHSIVQERDARAPLGAAEVAGVVVAAEEARVDLVVEARLRTGGKVGLVVEAKFGHRLTAGQLPKAVRHAASRGLDATNAEFVVALPLLENIGTRVFARQRGVRWSAVSWWDLLVAYERTLPAAADDEAFRSFRSLLWFHCYG